MPPQRAVSQEYNRFKVGLGLGLALIDNGDGGGLITLEPAYRARDDIAIGLRLEGGTLLGSAEPIYFGSYTVNAQYYFADQSFRPLFGLGLGVYNFSQAENTAIFGFYPRLGFDWGHFTTSLEYNILPFSSTYSHADAAGYLHLRLGFYVGGGKKD
jgi:hypothetical protein